MIFIKFAAKLFKILRSGESPNKIAAGFTLGMILGLTPLLTLHNFILILMLIILTINLASALFAFAIFSGVAYALDPLFHNLGYFILTGIPALRDLWTALFGFPLIALSRYNNTVVMGSLIVSIALSIPVFPAAKYFVLYYRNTLDPLLQKLKIVQLMKGSKLYTLYDKIKRLGG